jgi:prepilin-type N-terminal cleavage/methylation domain-containing protein
MSLEINRMNADHDMRKQARKQAFTLIELLVVIAIIAILAALVTPAISAALQRAKKAQVQTELQAIKTAVQAFYNDYSKLPLANGGFNGADQLYTASEPIIKVLTVNETGSSLINPRKIVYLETTSPDTDGTFKDAWGTQYAIKLDNTYDGKVDGYSTLCIVESAGPDKILTGAGKTNDNIRTTL